MMKANIRDWGLAVVLFLALAGTLFYFFPPFFITKAGQPCLIDYHCYNINCPGTMAKNALSRVCSPERVCVCSAASGTVADR